MKYIFLTVNRNIYFQISFFFFNARVPIIESFCNKIGPERPKTLNNACLETARVLV